MAEAEVLEFDRSVLGVEVDVGTFEVTKEQIVAFAQAVGETNPLFLDEAAAKAGPYGGLIAPPTFYSVFRTGSGLDPKVTFGTTGFNAGQHCEFFEPIRHGDVISARIQVADVYQKTGRTGSMVFILRRTTFSNQRGQKVAMVEQTYVRRDMGTS